MSSEAAAPAVPAVAPAADRLTELKAARQALKRQLAQATRDVKSQDRDCGPVYVIGTQPCHAEATNVIVPCLHVPSTKVVLLITHPLESIALINARLLAACCLRLAQEKKRRRIMKQAGKLSTEDLTWLLAVKVANGRP